MVIDLLNNDRLIGFDCPMSNVPKKIYIHSISCYVDDIDFLNLKNSKIVVTYSHYGLEYRESEKDDIILRVRISEIKISKIVTLGSIMRVKKANNNSLAIWEASPFLYRLTEHIKGVLNATKS